MTRFDTKRTVTDCSPDVSLWFCPIDGQNKNHLEMSAADLESNSTKKNHVCDDLWCAEGNALTCSPPSPTPSPPEYVAEFQVIAPIISNKSKTRKNHTSKRWTGEEICYHLFSPSLPLINLWIPDACTVGSPPNQNGEKPHIKMTNMEILLGRAREGGIT